ncbi:MAG: DUF4358 domain-containing protein [Lachnospiraceae bacterium]|nr:DUF4358 domain-containing protein [Lachnospiraceae bacterium]
MKKVILPEALALLVLAGIMALLLMKKTPADVPLSEIKERLTSQFTPEEMEEAGDMRLKRAFSLNAADFDEYIYFAPDNTMSVNEFLLIKCSDESRIPEILGAFENRLAVQKKNFEGYGTDQTALLNAAVTGSEGSYVWFIVGQDADAWLKAVKSAWEVKK